MESRDLIESAKKILGVDDEELSGRLGLKHRTLKRIISKEIAMSPQVQAHLGTLTRGKLPKLGNSESHVVQNEEPGRYGNREPMYSLVDEGGGQSEWTEDELYFRDVVEAYFNSKTKELRRMMAMEVANAYKGFTKALLLGACKPDETSATDDQKKR